MSEHSVLADGFAQILAEVNSWPECKGLLSNPSREMCDTPSSKDTLVFRGLTFPINYKARVTRCCLCHHVSLEIGLFQEADHEHVEIGDSKIPASPGG